MVHIFLELVNRSVAAGGLILAVLLVRLVLKNMPKKYFVVLWGLVAVRLVMPFSLESAFSFVPTRNAIPAQIVFEENADAVTGTDARNTDARNTSADAYANAGASAASKANASSTNSGATSKANASSTNTDAASKAEARYENVYANTDAASKAEASSVNAGVASAVTADFLRSAVRVGSVVWVIGCVGILSWALVNYFLLRRKTSIFTEEDGVRVCDYIETPFVFGIIWPRIYLPSSLSLRDRKYVIEHETAHIQRHDQIWKLAGYLLLAVYWFNPLVWLAFWLFSRDIEFACDEKVLDDLYGDQKKGYAMALLNCSVPHAMIAAAPLALADNNVEKRVKHILKYRKAAAWTSLLFLACCLLLSACFLTDPAGQASSAESSSNPSAESLASSAELSSNASTESPVAGEGDEALESMAVAQDSKAAEGSTEEEDTIGQDRPFIQDEAMNCVKSIVSMLDYRDDIHIEPDAFSTIQGYIQTRYLEAVRDYYKRAYAPGASIINQYEKTDGLVQDLGDQQYTLNIVCEVKYSLGKDELTESQVFSYNVTVKKEGDEYRCVDLEAVDLRDHIPHDPTHDLYGQMESEGVLEKTLQEQAAYVDDIYQRYFEVMGKGDINSVKIDEDSFVSERFSQEDFKAARDAIMEQFYNGMGYCRLDELRYVGEEASEEWRETFEDRYAADDFMVIQGDFSTGKRGQVSPAIEPETTYPDWSWLLGRNAAGGWEVVGQGY